MQTSRDPSYRWQVVTIFKHSVRTKRFRHLDEALNHIAKRRPWYNVRSVLIIPSEEAPE